MQLVSMCSGKKSITFSLWMNVKNGVYLYCHEYGEQKLADLSATRRIEKKHFNDKLPYIINT